MVYVFVKQGRVIKVEDARLWVGGEIELGMDITVRHTLLRVKDIERKLASNIYTLTDIKANKRIKKKMKNVEIFNDSFQNWSRYQIPKAQLIIADVPYNLDVKAYASNPSWYVDGDNKNGESDKAKSQFFYNDNEFRPAEFMHFCSKMLIKEPKGKVERQTAPCMVLFCEYEQQFKFIELGRKYGLMHYIPLVFRKNFSAQVLKANMKVVGNCEYGLILYRDKLPKFNNNGKMIFNCFDWTRELGAERIHPTQKPVPLLERLIEIFTDPGDVVIDPCAGSGSTLRAAANLGRKAYGFEVNKEFYRGAKEKMLSTIEPRLF